MMTKPNRNSACSGDEENETFPQTTSDSFWSAWLLHSSLLSQLSLRWMGGNHADAEDALSMAKIKAAIQFRSDSYIVRNQRAWLCRLLHNVCMDLYRRRKGFEEIRYEECHLSENAALHVPSPENCLFERELFRKVDTVLGELPSTWRYAIVERCLHNRSYEDIAREEGTTQSNIRKRVQLGRASLREQLSREGLPTASKASRPAASGRR